MKMFLFLALVVHSCVASPVSQSVRTDITAAVNLALKAYLNSITDPVALASHIEYNIDAPLIADVLLTMDGATLGGVKNIVAENCITTGTGPSDIELHFNVPELMLEVPAYTMDGLVVDHIPLQGDGMASITIENLDISLVGKGTIQLVPFSVQFTEIALDLELLRWTVNFEDLAPGTDLGTVFNQFFSMCGPEIFDLLEIRLNDGDWLLNFINGIFSF
ncbi:uncharacterized protein LOC122247523 isoform X2 [Penaeus japonicus]|uniref:uncharacterized protein LOC122247523 isoform X2 n=1 Tax=Penaeus japonicus TaxID=27405 RepID=UPI001C7169C0|nr:uncharacterized protein LOC122247523 isoform X2 [Penaeus japonicus]